MTETQTPGRAPANSLSHVTGDASAPLWDLTIPDLLARTVAAHPDREAAVFVEQGIRWTWSELAARIDDLAAGLAELGLGHGDRIGIWSPNRVEWLLTQFASARIGAILVCINPAYRVHELEYAMKLSGCAALVTATAFKGSNYVEMLQDLLPELPDADPRALKTATLPDLRQILCMGGTPPAGMLDFDAIAAPKSADARASLAPLSAALSPGDVINIQFTSGTTGSPKGASLTHRNIINNARFTIETMQFDETDRLCIPVPFYHCFGMVMGTLGCATTGSAMVVPSEGFEPLSTLKTVAQERCTALYGVPTMFVAELDHPEFSNFDLSSLRTGIMAGAPCPIEVMKRVQSQMHMAGVTIAYGMTETSPVSFQSNVDDPLDKRVSSVGRVHPHVEVRIVNDQDQTVLTGTQGELLTRGYSVMKSYWNDPAKTADAVQDGWMRTGDLATMDDQGYVAITGRVKDMICRGGENIYPREIEDFLFTHPAIAQAQVFGIPDDYLGEIVCAFVVPKPDAELSEEDVIAFCRDRIAHFKVPKHVRLHDDLPMTVTGKPQKFIMRDLMVADLGQSN